MSDSDAYSSEESYEFEFEDENEDIAEDQVPDSNLENKYYCAKGLKDDSTAIAIQELETLLHTEASSLDDYTWCFRSCKQLMKLYYKEGQLDKVLETVLRLTKLAPHVGSVYAEESIGRLLASYGASADLSFVKKFHDIILSYVQRDNSSSSTRIWLKIHISKASLLLEDGELDEANNLIKDIKLQLNEASENVQNAFGIECLALEIEYYSRLLVPDNLTELQTLYHQSMEMSTALTHPRITGVIRECGGKVFFYLSNFERARLEFYDSFKSYDEAGSNHKKKILKYLAVCSLTVENEVDPFESHETQLYAQLPEYSDLIFMIKQYDDLDLDGYDRAVAKVQQNDSFLGSDDIFRRSAELIKHNLRSKILTNLLKSYKTIRFESIMDSLHISQAELEHMVIHLSNHGKVSGINMDFFDNVVEMRPPSSAPFPSQARPASVLNNIKTLAGLQTGTAPATYEKGESSRCFDIDVLFCSADPSAQYSISQISECLQCFISAIPGQAKTSMSQKDQIYFEQRAENTPGNANAKNQEQSDVNAETEQVSTRVSLSDWCRELKTLQKKVSAH